MNLRTVSYIFALIAPLSTLVAATKTEKVREIIATQISQETIEELRLENVEETKQLMLKQVGERGKDPLMGRLLERAFKKYDEFSKELFDWKARERETIAFYEEYFTAEQIDAIWTFYRSEAGKALLEAQPIMLSRMQKALFQTEADRRARIDRIIKETIAEIEKELRSERTTLPKPQSGVKLEPPAIPSPNLK